jgi:hypothetical protein
MIDDLYSLDNQWLAAVRLQPELSVLVETAHLPKMRSLTTSLAPNTDETTRLEAAVCLQDILTLYPAARQRFVEALHLQTGLQSILTDHGTQGAEVLGMNENDRLRAIAEIIARVRGDLAAPITNVEQPRLVRIGVGGIDGGQVISLRNLIVDFKSLGEMVASVLLAGKDMLDTPHPIFVAAGLFLVIRSLVDGVTVSLDTEEASVFWGFIQTCGRDQRAVFNEIVAATNHERQRYQLGPLEENRVARALQTLAQLGAIQQQDQEWVQVDRYEITG